MTLLQTLVSFVTLVSEQLQTESFKLRSVIARWPMSFSYPMYDSCDTMGPNIQNEIDWTVFLINKKKFPVYGRLGVLVFYRSSLG